MRYIVTLEYVTSRQLAKMNRILFIFLSICAGIYGLLDLRTTRKISPFFWFCSDPWTDFVLGSSGSGPWIPAFVCT